MNSVISCSVLVAGIVGNALGDRRILEPPRSAQRAWNHPSTCSTWSWLCAAASPIRILV